MKHQGSELDRATRALADDLHHFSLTRYETRPAGDIDPAALVEHERATAAEYEQRFAGRARETAAALIAKGAERRDALFGHVDRGPTDEHDVFQITSGLIRVTNAVHLAGLRATG